MLGPCLQQRWLCLYPQFLMSLVVLALAGAHSSAGPAAAPGSACPKRQPLQASTAPLRESLAGSEQSLAWSLPLSSLH